MTPYRMPLLATPQTLSITLAGVVYNLNVYWCRQASAWILDIADSANRPLLNGVPLVTGADLLAQYGYLGFGGQLIAQTDHNALLPPTFDNLGSAGNLYFVVGS